MSLKYAGLGTLIGLLVGAGRDRDPGESRGHAMARSGATGLATDLGVAGGAALGMATSGVVGNKRVLRLNPKLRAIYDLASTKNKIKGLLRPDSMLHGHASGSALGGIRGGLHANAGLLGLVAGGAGAYGLAHRRPKSRLQKLRETFKLGGEKHARLKLALGINRDDGINLVMARLQEGLKQARARKLAQAPKLAALTSIGAIRGLVRDPGQDQTRAGAVKHDAGVGLAGDLGGIVGAGVGSVIPASIGALAGLPRAKGGVGRVLHLLRRASRGLGVAGAVGGGLAGALIGMQQTRRQPVPTRVKQLPYGEPGSY